MFILSGTLINIFETPKGKTKEGEEYGGDFKLQILHENTLRNGEKRADLVELTVSDTSLQGEAERPCKRSCGRFCMARKIERTRSMTRRGGGVR